jgi:hypothetical protein
MRLAFKHITKRNGRYAGIEFALNRFGYAARLIGVLLDSPVTHASATAVRYDAQCISNEQDTRVAVHKGRINAALYREKREQRPN